MRRLSLSVLGLVLTNLVVLADEPRVKTVQVRGTVLSYVDEGGGEPVVFLHGAMHDYRSWIAQVPAFSKRYRAIAYSARYNYPNPPLADGANFSIATDVLDAIALIEALKLGPVHLVGHSRGGTIALRIAVERPDLVRSLILGEPGAPGLMAQNAEARALRPDTLADDAREAYKRGDVARAAQLVAESVTGVKGGWTPDPTDVHQTEVLENLPREFKAQETAPARSGSPVLTCDAVGRIKAPMLIVMGEHTTRRSQLVVEELQKCAPGSERAILTGTNHALQLEKPAEFNTIALEFLVRRGSRRPGM